MEKYILNFIVFVSGAIVMIYELVGSRLISPYVGTSIYVLSSLIGVILGALSLGYHLGGKLADKRAEWKVLSEILLCASLFIGLTAFSKNAIPEGLNLLNLRSEYAAFFVSLFMFGPASVLLGMISPFSVKLKITDLKSSASAVGNLYAVSTIGGIAGTFAAGFFIIPFFGTTRVLLFMAVILLFLSIIAYGRQFLKTRIAFILFFAGLIIFEGTYAVFAKKGVIEIDTPYNKVWIEYSKAGEKPILLLSTDPFAAQSAIFLTSDDLVFKYTRYFRLARHFQPDIRRALMIGGCGFSYPKDFLRSFKDATMDVVEIDPGMTELARKYFRLKDNPRLAVFHEDARTFLNRTRNKYDVIYCDAFNSFSSVPYQLATKEAVEKIYRALNSNGIVMQNIISAINGKKGEFLREEIATYKQYFPQVYIFQVNGTSSYEPQNIILMALKSGTKPTFKSPDKELNDYLKSVWKEIITLDVPVLTDDFAPVEYYKYRSL